jgi:hemerythrin-like domain-containing protein
MPIKRNINLVSLSKEHHFTLLFCWKIRQGIKLEVDLKRIVKYVQYFWQHFLMEHFKEEEQELFIVNTEDNLVQKAFHDHTEIEKQIQFLLNDQNDISTQQLLTLANDVDAHIRFEERELFPHLEKNLSEEQLNIIGQHLSMDKTTMLNTDAYADSFWVHK